jgi:hypothetical protein
MNGWNDDHEAAYGPQDEDDWRKVQDDLEALALEQWDIDDGPACPRCGWGLDELENGELVCTRCGKVVSQ